MRVRASAWGAPGDVQPSDDATLPTRGASWPPPSGWHSWERAGGVAALEHSLRGPLSAHAPCRSFEAAVLDRHNGAWRNGAVCLTEDRPPCRTIRKIDTDMSPRWNIWSSDRTRGSLRSVKA